MNRKEARIANRREDMPAIVVMVERFGAEHELPSAKIHELNAALDEVLSNIIDYAYGEGEHGEILVRLTYRRPDEVVVDIEDTGSAFYPLQVSQSGLTTPLKQRNAAGVGIHFKKSLMDEVVYARREGTNQLRLRKKLSAAQARSLDGTMELIESEQDGVVIVEPRGRIDTLGAKPFGDRMVELIRSGSSHILIDLEHILYISSAGFRSLLIARKLMDEVNGKLVLCGMSAELKRLFEIGAFTDLFDICATREEGVGKAQ